jgi:hypothetical protein
LELKVEAEDNESLMDEDFLLMNDQRKLFLEMKSAPMKIQLTLLK